VGGVAVHGRISTGVRGEPVNFNVAAGMDAEFAGTFAIRDIGIREV
jgi:hypothetical protein